MRSEPDLEDAPRAVCVTGADADPRAVDVAYARAVEPAMRPSISRTAAPGGERRSRPGAPSVAGLFALLLLAACEPDGDDDSGPCAGGALAASATPNRLHEMPLDDGVEVPVFPPPQGGVFTELDVAIFGTSAEQVEWVRVRVDDASGAMIANQEYRGEGLPLQCLPEGNLVVYDLPVGFDASVLDPAQLDGEQATLRLGIDTRVGDLVEEWSVVLRATD